MKPIIHRPEVNQQQNQEQQQEQKQEKKYNIKGIFALMLMMYVSGAGSTRYHYNQEIAESRAMQEYIYVLGLEALEKKQEDSRLSRLYSAGYSAGAELKRGGV